MQTTTPHGELSLNIYHPQMQEVLLERARAAGAEVKRGATVVGVEAAPHRPPAITFALDGVRETLSAQVVVGADGRDCHLQVGWNSRILVGGRGGSGSARGISGRGPLGDIAGQERSRADWRRRCIN
jgi:hypothetical protein